MATSTEFVVLRLCVLSGKVEADCAEHDGECTTALFSRGDSVFPGVSVD